MNTFYPNNGFKNEVDEVRNAISVLPYIIE